MTVKIKPGLRFKFALIFLGLILMVALASAVFLYRSMAELTRQQRMDYAASVARIVNGMVDEKALREYVQRGEEDEAYRELLDSMKRIQCNSNVYYLYVVAVENEEDGVYIFDLKLVDGEAVLNHGLGERNNIKKNYPGISVLFSSKSYDPVFDKMTFEGEALDSVYAPIRNEEGELTAFVGIDFMDRDFAESARNEIRGAGLFLSLIMLVCFLVLMLIVQIGILRPIYRLREQAERVEQGEFGGGIEVRGHDELSEISRVFNQMTRSIAENMDGLQRVSDAYYRYVPARILTLLGRKSIEDVRLGDETSGMYTIFSFQVADFDRTIRQKDNQEMIDAINHVLQLCVPLVADRNGMVEYFWHAGFNALFDSDCEPALLSAVDICRSLNRMEGEGTSPAIGIACGEVALGIVGQEKRMAAVTVSQYRDTALWLQGIAESFQSHILITRAAAERIPGFHKKYRARLLGFFLNTYTGLRDQVYDVYEGDPVEELEKKEDTKGWFEEGVELYCTGNPVEARRRFIEVLKRFRRDRAAKEYLYLCDRRIAGKGGDEEDIYFTKIS